ncbi:MAG: CRISPR system precrRNA processing endoribonuclease RAMP protein Cas6 [Candidatus Riflebacteria bacterium]|nr:CRISPR system precrRNA processing endoribonuclease RAMP protein Cas6 [Candidatus Riflebacteria bacterium]
MRYMHLNFTFEAGSDITFNQNPANTFRGALGFQLRDIACFQTKNSKLFCNKCSHFKDCAYALCYETGQSHVSGGFSEKNLDMPHLMTADACFEGGKLIKRGERFSFSVWLYGKAVEAVLKMILAAHRAGNIGFGMKDPKTVCPLIEIKDGITASDVWSRDYDKISLPKPSNIIIGEPLPEYNSDCEVTLRFVSPVSFKDNKSGRTLRHPDFFRVVGSLMRRYSSFMTSEGKQVDWNFAEISRVAKEVKAVKSDLREVSWERFSQRQRRRMSCGGVVGTVAYRGPASMFLDLLKLGEIVKCGRKTTFGQGKFKVVSVNQDLGQNAVRQLAA